MRTCSQYLWIDIAAAFLMFVVGILSFIVAFAIPLHFLYDFSRAVWSWLLHNQPSHLIQFQTVVCTTCLLWPRGVFSFVFLGVLGVVCGCVRGGRVRACMQVCVRARSSQ